MPAGLLLSFAILAEVAATVALRASHGFSRPVPAVVVVVGYALSFWLLALVLKQMELGFVYAVWAGAGTALIAAIGIFGYGEPATALKLASIGLVVAGVVGLNAAGAH